jgi:hypothetical protein
MIFIIIKKLYVFFLVRDFKKVFKIKKNIFVSYLSEPFYKENDMKYMNKHQNRIETLLMEKVFSKLGFGVHFRRFDKKTFFPGKYDIIFGIEPNFGAYSKRNKDSLKIYYATGAYYEHQNKMVKDRTDHFNLIHNTNVPYIRTVKPHNSCVIADYIIQIGSKFTVETYPPEVREKIITIRQSCHNFSFNNFIERKIANVQKNHFIWMGSQGSILKGLDIVLDFFISQPNLHIHIFGEIDGAVYNYYSEYLQNDNIHLYGFVDLDSEIIEDITLISAFVIMPSASEGMPGSVLNLMKLGCIPIVTKYAAFDEIEEYGFLMESINLNSLAKCVESSQKLEVSYLKQKVLDCYNYANNNYNKMTFHEDLLKAFETLTTVNYKQ